MEKEETNLESAEKFLRSKYKLIDFHMLHINGHPWLELMEEYHRLKSAHPSRQGDVELPSDERITEYLWNQSFSEVECKAVGTFVKWLRDKIKSQLSPHPSPEPLTDFFEPKENKEYWMNLYKEISEILFKGGKARHIIEHLYKFPSPESREVDSDFKKWLNERGWKKTTRYFKHCGDNEFIYEDSHNLESEFRFEKKRKAK